MKKIGIVKTVNEINNTLKYLDGYILGIKNLSINLPFYFGLKELEKIIYFLNENNKDIYISLNKNMHNEDLSYLKEVLMFLEKFNIKAIMYYDVALINLKSDKITTKELIWSQEHLTCNYATINFYKHLGVNGTLLSNEITLEEIKTIKNNTDSNLFLQLFGHIPMFASRRNLVKNYLDTFNLKNSDNYKIHKEGYYYPIINRDNICEVYTSNIINGLRESMLLKEALNGVILSSAFIKEEDFINILKLYSANEIDKLDEFVYSSYPNTDKGFLYKETIYKVKRK